MTVVADLIEIIVTAISGLLEGIGGSIVSFFDNVFVTSTGEITVFATVMLSFVGIGFALFFVRWLLSRVNG
ncbi:MAG: hypothetical protein LBT30_04985 [Clostridiales bacterium]|jgi:hypothetical protein|nr:hypothetical protein [Clostridiales bacterium]